MRAQAVGNAAAGAVVGALLTVAATSDEASAKSRAESVVALIKKTCAAYGQQGSLDGGFISLFHASMTDGSDMQSYTNGFCECEYRYRHPEVKVGDTPEEVRRKFSASKFISMKCELSHSFALDKRGRIIEVKSGKVIGSPKERVPKQLRDLSAELVEALKGT